MISAIISFLGGSVFRMIWGEVSTWVTAKQNHAQELERLRLQGEMDAAQHSRNLESIRVQAELGAKEIRVKAEADLSRIDAEGFYGAARDAMKPTGIWLVDLWNGVIRPLCATIAVAMWVLSLYRAGWVLGPWDQELTAAVLGFFFADRALGKRGK